MGDRSPARSPAWRRLTTQTRRKGDGEGTYNKSDGNSGEGKGDHDESACHCTCRTYATDDKIDLRALNGGR